jgi:hypothetical protein
MSKRYGSQSVGPMRLLNSAQIKQATGDVFGRFYEYWNCPGA